MGFRSVKTCWHDALPAILEPMDVMEDWGFYARLVHLDRSEMSS